LYAAERISQALSASMKRGTASALEGFVAGTRGDFSAASSQNSQPSLSTSLPMPPSSQHLSPAFHLELVG
jgi:hypothetical protein